MFSELENARMRADIVRYSYDNLKSVSDIFPSGINKFKDLLSYQELKITNAVSPSLFKIISNVCKIFTIPISTIDAYVYRSSEIQAVCIADDDRRCIVRFSSGLINLLDHDEFCFVVGHEIGHFLLLHHQTRIDQDTYNLESVMQQRNQEISADRLGLIACNSIDIALKTIMKMVSGLTEEHLRFDVGAFVSQLNNIKLEELNFSSHPSMIVRGRALLWFSMEELKYNNIDALKKENLLKLDKRIYNDFCKYVDGPINNIINEAKQELQFWLQVEKIIEKKVFSKGDQKNISDKFGLQKLESLKKFLSTNNQSAIKKLYLSRIEEARSKLESLIPHAFNDVVISLTESLEN